ncbi:hypothetical protein FNF28_02588 [Cafeteria roenbergensis]|uniref:PH domain-containing protein n=1 Tax=Cafeteria roenbergensis TaxID=33653 RepID=A0A5A8DSK5_CAFRO|nr:hypothetical protein FNF28_02588 [Cafeteria roenbergensis]
MSASAAAAGGGDTSLKRKRTKHALVDVAAAWEPSREGSALNSAAKALDLERLQALVEDGAHPDARDKTGMAALHQAAVLGSLPMVHLLLRAGASVNPADSFGDTPLHYAAHCGHVGVVAALLEAGADPTIPSLDGQTPLGSALAEGQSAAAQVMADMFPVACGDLIPEAVAREAEAARDAAAVAAANAAMFSSSPSRPVADAAPSPASEAAWELVAGRLGDACLSGDLGRVRAMLAEGARPSGRDAFGFSPLHRAAAAGNVAIIETLVAAGADVNASDNRGCRPVHIAALCGHVDSAHALISAGADGAAASYDGLTPAAAARAEGHGDVGQGQAEWVPTSGAELTLTHGIAVEGPLKVKRPSGVFKWASRYALASAAMRALVLWAGDGSSIEGGEVQWLPFAAVVGVVHHAGKKSGRRFDVTLRGGAAPLALLAESAAEASAWVSALRRALVAAQESSSQERIIGGIMPPIGTALALEAALKAAKKAERLRGEAEATADELQAKLRVASSSSGGWTDSGSSATELSDAERPRHAGPRASTVLEPVTEDEHEPPTAAVSVSGKASGSSVGSGGGSGVGSGSHVSRGSAGSTPAMPSSSGPQPRRPLSTGNTPGGKTSPKSRRPTSRTTTSLALAMGTASFADGSTSSAGSSGASRAGSAASRGKGKTRPPGERMLPWRTNQTGGELSRRLALAAAGSARGAAGGAAGGGASLSGGPGLRSGLITRQRASSKASSGSSVGAAAAVTAALAARARKGPSGPRDAAAIKLQAAARRWLAARVVSGWQRVVDDDGDIFWYHAGSDTSSWYPPGLDPGEPPSDTEVA